MSTSRVQARLLILAGAFLFIYCLLLTLSPAARSNSWAELVAQEYHWGQWGILAVWIGVFTLIHRQIKRILPEYDPYLLPIAALLSGWGLLMIYRLYPDLGLKQALLLIIAGALLILGLHLPNLDFLRHYKYLWLVSGLAITGLTFLFGTNPLGFGPRLWLGCCDLYFQPSEPLKLLLVVYLAAYLADRFLPTTSPASAGGTGGRGDSLISSLQARLISPPLLPLLAPTLVLTGVAIVLLVAQRDLGTASIFFLLYAIVVYIATGRQRILWMSAILLILAGLVGYVLFDVVRLRVEAWLNPWLDPSGRSYQIVQSLLAVANGGLFGRGPGLGSPALVPIPHSDFIFAAISEESGMLGALGLLLLLGFFSVRSLRTAFYAPDAFQQYLAAGLAGHLGLQSILIIGGNLRLLPLTGVTLPFVSYGGSSLLTSFFSLLILLYISHTASSAEISTASVFRPSPRPYRQLAFALCAGLVLASIGSGWWGFYRGPVLLTRTDNARRAIDDRYVYRGALLDRHGLPLSQNTGSSGSYRRVYLYPKLSSVLGYTHPVYGQSGLEAGLDEVLRGLQGNSDLSVWWNHLVYGHPPPGLDIRLSLDLSLQKLADENLDGQTGALVLLDSSTGEILAMASHPTFDANTLDGVWDKLVKDKQAPLLNRATQGSYPTGSATGPLLLAAFLPQGAPAPTFPAELDVTLDKYTLDCALPMPNTQTGQVLSSEKKWGRVVAAGCPVLLTTLVKEGEQLNPDSMRSVIKNAGLDSTPNLGLPVAEHETDITAKTELIEALFGTNGLQTSPLQLALAVAALNNNGIRPAPRLALAMKTNQQGWVDLLPPGSATSFLPAEAAARAADLLAQPGLPIWQMVSKATLANATPTNTPMANSPQANPQKADTQHTSSGLTWYLGGTLPGRNPSPLTLVLVLENSDPATASKIGQAVLQTALESYHPE